MPTPALAELLTGLVDFAGLFPPAAMDMASAVRAYARYRSGPHAGYLGAFVVPATRLDEFAGEVSGLGGVRAGDASWPVSVLAGEPADADIKAALGFERPAVPGPGLQVVSIEAKVQSAEMIGRISATVPESVGVTFEIPLSIAREERRAILAAVKAAGRTAKLRTGGVTAEAIPPTSEVAGFIWDCARAGVPFKATAGLHHPVRAEQRLTYAADSPRATMHGFLNVFLASAAAWVAAQSEKAEATPGPPAAVIGLLEEQDPSSFRFDGAALRWRGVVITAADIAGTRSGLARSFGSCSFVEPVSDLETLGWLPHE